MNIQLLSSKYTVRYLTLDDVDIIYNLSAKNKLFYKYHPPFVSRESILEDMDALPPGKEAKDKFYIGFFEKENLAAVMDLILDYPKEKVAFLGLFMMEQEYQGKGVGTEIIQECIRYLGELGYSKIRLAIDKGNPQSEAFWTKNGFTKTGEEYPNEVSVYLPMEVYSCRQIHLKNI